MSPKITFSRTAKEILADAKETANICHIREGYASLTRQGIEKGIRDKARHQRVTVGIFRSIPLQAISEVHPKVEV